jgi:cytochrome c peroxidase
MSPSITYAGINKVPTLRNVAMTRAYFHDASVATLDEQ